MEVRAAYHSDASAILELLVRIMPGGTRKGARSRWEKLFAVPWQEAATQLGYLLEEDRVIKGFIATVFSKRFIRNKTYRIVNLSSWAVEEAYRSASLSLLAPILALKDCTITDLSASPQAAAILQALGFKVLDAKRLFFPALPQLAIGKKLTFCSDKEAIKQMLTPEEQELFLAHKDTGCFHTVVTDVKGHALYLIGSIRQIRWLRCAYIHYCSNRSIFAEHAGQIAWYSAQRFKTSSLLIDSRLVENQNKIEGICIHQTLKTPMLYRSQDKELLARDIDSLFTERVLLTNE